MPTKYGIPSWRSYTCAQSVARIPSGQVLQSVRPGEVDTDIIHRERPVRIRALELQLGFIDLLIEHDAPWQVADQSFVEVREFKQQLAALSTQGCAARLSPASLSAPGGLGAGSRCGGASALVGASPLCPTPCPLAADELAPVRSRVGDQNQGWGPLQQRFEHVPQCVRVQRGQAFVEDQ